MSYASSSIIVISALKVSQCFHLVIFALISSDLDLKIFYFRITNSYEYVRNSPPSYSCNNEGFYGLELVAMVTVGINSSVIQNFIMYFYTSL